MIIQKTR